jgi:DNA invertase Pin-like site-specific DNA recombinase
LVELLDHARAGDVVVVWRLDRLGRSLRHLIDTVRLLEDRGVGFRSLTEAIDTSSSGGKLVFHVFAALAEFERDLIRERTRAGLAAARARGRVGGRPRKWSQETVKQAIRMHQEGIGISEIARILCVSRATVYRNLASCTQVDGAGEGSAHRVAEESVSTTRGELHV